MARRRQEIRDGHKWCDFHKAWEELSQFDRKDDRDPPNYEANCRLARQTKRDESNAGTDTAIRDPMAAATRFVQSRADEVVRRLRFTGVRVSRRWVMEELNYQSWIAPLAAYIGPDGSCLTCAGPFTKKHRISLDHGEPPRWDGTIDWERLHARNLQAMHFGENGSKNEKPYAIWLHDDHLKWVAAREWAKHAGEPGWPTLEQMRLPPPEPSPEPDIAPDDGSVQLTIDDMLDDPFGGENHRRVNAGSRVQTPAGPGRVIHLDQDENWTFGKPNRRQWILVEHDNGSRRIYSSNDVEEQDEIPWPE